MAALMVDSGKSSIFSLLLLSLLLLLLRRLRLQVLLELLESPPP